MIFATAHLRRLPDGRWMRRTRAGHTAERFWDWGVDLFTPDGSRVLVRSAQEWRRIAGEPAERPSQPVLDAVIAGEE